MKFPKFIFSSTRNFLLFLVIDNFRHICNELDNFHTHPPFPSLVSSLSHQNPYSQLVLCMFLCVCVCVHVHTHVCACMHKREKERICVCVYCWRPNSEPLACHIRTKQLSCIFSFQNGSFLLLWVFFIYPYSQ